MEIKIRGLDRNIVATIDDMALASGKSRNAFLKKQIEMIAKAPELKRQEEKYEVLLREMAMVMQRNTDVFLQLMEE